MSADIDLDRLRAIQFELEYWRAFTGDALQMNDAISSCADGLSDAIVALLTLQTCPADHRSEFSADAMNALNRSVNQLQQMQKPLRQMIDLAKGRERVLDAAVDGATGGVEL